VRSAISFGKNKKPNSLLMPSRPIPKEIFFYKIPEESKMGGSSIATAQFNEINLAVRVQELTNMIISQYRPLLVLIFLNDLM
jgi:hypothetical protein